MATAVVTIVLKATSYFLTGSVGLLSDALESIVNLVAAVAALIALVVAERPANEDPAYGHSKAEYFSSGFEGGLIVLAAASIVAVAIPRLIRPEQLADVALGVAISMPGPVLNVLVAWPSCARASSTDRSPCKRVVARLRSFLCVPEQTSHLSARQHEYEL